MEATKSYPRFIKNTPCGEDLFEGKSQQKIANNICNIIRTEKSCNIIGIDGGWGSGKSNLVKQVENVLSKQGYHFFVFDAWGHQEDLQRRSFLEELTENLTEKELIKGDWKLKLKKLLSKVKETESKRVPKLSIGVIVLALLILITPLFKTMGEKITNHFLSLLMTAIPLFLVVGLFTYYFLREKEGIFIQKLKLTFTRLFLEYQNKLEEETKYEMISEDEPSVRKFRNWMLDISHDLAEMNLILVFDNMDRLPQKKVQELWSSIHVFFCEHSYDNIKVIVPFDREHIKLAFKAEDLEGKQYGDDFINKTFNVVYRVSPPILSDWKNYFTSQWQDAFGEEETLVNSNDVIQTFDLLSEEITPRRIIAFINEFVSIKQTVRETIPNKYIALFILGKDSIVKKPIDEIIKPSFLKGLTYLYVNDDELPKYLAALFYQVEPEKAIQVVFADRIKKALDEKATDELKKFSAIPEFHYILDKAIADVSNYENAILALNELSDEKLGNKYEAEVIWNCLHKKLTPRNKSQISEYQLILLSKIKNQSGYLKIILNELTADPEFSSTDYFDSINTIDNKFKATLSVFSELTKKQTSVQDFINFIDKAKADYQKYKLVTTEKELNDHLISVDIPKLKEVDFIPFIKSEYSFESFEKKLEYLIKENAPKNDKETMSVLYSRYKEVSQEKPLKEKLDDVTIYNLFNSCTEADDFYYDLTAMRISKLDKFSSSFSSIFDTVLQKTNEEVVKKIAEQQEYYLTYDEILLGLKTFNNNPLFKAIAKYLSVNSVGTYKADIVKLISNFKEICELGEFEPKVLLKKLECWSSFYMKEVNKDNVKQTVSPFFLEVSKDESFETCKHSLEIVKEYLNSLSEENWKEAFKDLRSYEIEVSLIVGYEFPTSAFEALKFVLKEIAEGSLPIPDKSRMDTIMGKLVKQGKSFKATFNSVRDSLDRLDNISIPLFNFFGDWLFNYADLADHQSSLRTIFKPDIIRDNGCIQIISTHREKLPAIIREAKGEAQDFTELIQDLLSNGVSHEFADFARFLGIEARKKEETNEETEI